MAVSKQFSEETKAKILKDVADLQKSGMNLTQALEKTKTSFNNYYRWARGGKKSVAFVKPSKAKKPQVMTFQEIDQPKAPLIVLMGNPDDVNKALASLAFMNQGRTV